MATDFIKSLALDNEGRECDYCGEPMRHCPCGLLIHWDHGGDCPNCGKMPPELDVWQSAPDGYARRNPPMIEYRRMTIAEAQALRGSHVAILANDGTVRRAKINGVVKVWKTRPNDVRVPVKYGLYEYGELVPDGESGFVTYGIIRKDGAA